MLHDESRKLLLKAWDKTHDAKKVAEFFSVNTSTMYRLVNHRDRTDEWRTNTHLRGRKSALSQEQKQAIIQLVQDQPDIWMKAVSILT